MVDFESYMIIIIAKISLVGNLLLYICQTYTDPIIHAFAHTEIVATYNKQIMVSVMGRYMLQLFRFESDNIDNYGWKLTYYGVIRVYVYSWTGL